MKAPENPVPAAQVVQERQFRVAYKKLHPHQKSAVNQAIRDLVENPLAGKEKAGDLRGIFVHKFSCAGTEYLLAYLWDPQTRVLLALGVHENFYRDLKR